MPVRRRAPGSSDGCTGRRRADRGGKLYLTRGAVFSYYEFTSNKRITDEEWQAMLKEGRQPALPDWTGSFTDIGGPLPEPDLNYIWGE